MAQKYKKGDYVHVIIDREIGNDPKNPRYTLEGSDIAFSKGYLDSIKSLYFPENGHEIIKLMERLVNHFGDVSKEVMYSYRDVHKTLKQSMGREIILPIIRAEAEGYADPRNQAWHDLCVKMLTAIEGQDGLPLI